MTSPSFQTLLARKNVALRTMRNCQEEYERAEKLGICTDTAEHNLNAASAAYRTAMDAVMASAQAAAAEMAQ